MATGTGANATVDHPNIRVSFVVLSKLRHVLLSGYLVAAIGFAQQPAPKSADAQSEKPVESQHPDEPGANPEASPATPQPARGSGQNLLGQADTARGEGRRNENVPINLVDNNAARDAN